MCSSLSPGAKISSSPALLARRLGSHMHSPGQFLSLEPCEAVQKNWRLRSSLSSSLNESRISWGWKCLCKCLCGWLFLLDVSSNVQSRVSGCWTSFFIPLHSSSFLFIPLIPLHSSSFLFIPVLSADLQPIFFSIFLGRQSSTFGLQHGLRWICESFDPISPLNPPRLPTATTFNLTRAAASCDGIALQPHLRGILHELQHQQPLPRYCSCTTQRVQGYQVGKHMPRAGNLALFRWAVSEWGGIPSNGYVTRKNEHEPLDFGVSNFQTNPGPKSSWHLSYWFHLVPSYIHHICE